MRVKGTGPAVVFPHALVGSAGVAELLMAALLGDPAAVEHHDVVHLVQPVGLVGDEQDGAAFGGLQQIGGQRLTGVAVGVGGGFVDDQQRRVGEERAGQREGI